MLALKGKYCYLRALEPEDLEFLYYVENDELVWEVSETVTPYSRFVLKQYLENSHRDIYDVKQLRLAIVSQNDQLAGFIDLFDFDPKNARVGVGIIVAEMFRGQGLAKEALAMITNYCFQKLNLHQVYANITEDNLASKKLFESQDFELFGVKKDWIFSEGKYKNELFYQKIKE
ncbi:diamine N-acetyltransferase [Pustulibacterium marinum]|uniref:Diamine N-acetyltransferase n=1 Tax=Pustulibacterium marinum TaxID=1224947 RepID=A0A1I7FNH5_9FLAO|nr:GNAT family N-acetyltransferase [Pustulibacterium marinum]SFU37759.1 diamine N-acetyltransferase [Pustulibacterium marinum]